MNRWIKKLPKILSKVFIVFLIFVWIFSGWPRIWQNPRIPPEIKEAKAVNVLTNPSFTGGTTGWTLSNFTYDSTYYQDTAGSIKAATAVGRNLALTGTASQTISVNIIGGSIVKLSLFFSKQCVTVACGINTVQVDIAKPSAPTTWITIWSDNTIPAAGGATPWTGPSNLDVSSYFNETGTYNFRLLADLKSGNNKSAQALAWFDNITLDVTPPAFNQSAYRFFNNLDSTDVGTPLADQDTPATLTSSGQAFRLRLLIHVGTANLAQSGESFKLQFGTSTGSSCSTGPPSSWVDVTNATVIAFNDNPTPTDGSALTANSNDPTHGTDTIRNQTYEEANPFTNSVSAINAGEDGKWDFSLKDNGAPANTTYCFRVVKADGTLLDTYSVIPQITTGAAAIISVSVSDGSIDYGIIPASSTKSTCDLSDTQIVTNDGNVTENFNIKGVTTTCWSLGTAPGNEVYVHKFSTSSCPVDWTGAPALSTDYQPLATGIAPNGTTTLNLQVITPTNTNCYTQQSVNVIIQAVQP